ALLVDLDGVDADVRARVLMLGDGGLEGLMDVLQPVRQDVAKPDECWQADATTLQVVYELLEIDRTIGILGWVDFDLPVCPDREVSLPPSLDFVQLRRIGDSPGLAHVMGGANTSGGVIHRVSMICGFGRR